MVMLQHQHIYMCKIDCFGLKGQMFCKNLGIATFIQQTQVILFSHCMDCLNPMVSSCELL
jgi:hypothetical protein